MKKNISINISGIIFHIEEDGYEQLKNYLESISEYFSSFDDSGEIIADIESRIAEIFLSKLNEGKQIITTKDVSSLMTTMGSVQDFQAVEEPEVDAEVGKEVGSEEVKEKKKSGEQKQEAARQRKLYRDSRRKLLGGVAAGIAHYFSIDPLWIRLLFVLLATDVFISHSLGVLILITYIILWIILPQSDLLEEDQSIKKMYRNPEDRVMGGVSSGIAVYFGVDVTIVRLLFVLSIFFAGTGLIVYLVLWIILPEAVSITDKVQMKGEPVTLENIESNIKKSLNVDEAADENLLVKILLFPFRLIAIIFTGIGRVLGPILLFLVEVVRILLGLLLVVCGIAGIFVLLITLGVILGLFAAGGGIFGWYDFPVELISEAFPAWSVIVAFMACFIPALAISLLGLSVVAKTKVMNATVGWTLFGLWIFSLIGLSFAIPRIVYSFQTEANYEETQTFNITAESINLNLNETGDDEFDFTELSLKGYDGKELKLIKEYRAFGSSRKDAIVNAQSVGYNVVARDSSLTFDSNIYFKEGAKFRFQELDMTLYIPYGQNFKMSDNLRHILKYYTISGHGYYFYQLENNNWVFNPSGLECLSCYDIEEQGRERSEGYRRSLEESFKVYGYYEEYDFEDFNDLSISGAYEVQIIQNETYRIVLNGDKEEIQKTTLELDSDQLTIIHDREMLDYRRYHKQVKIIIGLPKLSSMELNGATRAYIKGFEEERVSIELNGASEADVDMDVYEIDIQLSGASKLTITGTGHEMQADLSAASVLDAYDFRVDDARIDASVASSAKVYVRENLDINASIASDIKYRGGARVRTNRSRKWEE